MTQKFQLMLIVSLLGAIVEPSSAAQRKKLGYNEALNLAMSQSFEIEAQKLDMKSKEFLADQSGVWSNPEISYEREQTKESAGSSDLNTFGIAQTFSIPGKFDLRRKVFGADTEVSRVTLEAKKSALNAEVTRLIYLFNAAKEKEKHALERVKRFETVETFLKTRTFASPQKKAEANLVQSRLLVIQKELSAAMNERQTAWEHLNFYLKLDSESEIEASWIIKGQVFNSEKLLSKSEGENWETKIQQLNVDKAQAEMSLAQNEQIPEFKISAKTAQASGIKDDKTLGLGISMPLPIFNTNRSAVSAFDAKKQSEAQLLKLQMERVKVDLRTALYTFESRKALLDKMPVSKISELEKQVNYADQEFKRGRIDILTYLETDLQHSVSVAAILDSQVDYIESLVVISRLTGQDLNLFGDMK